MEEQIFPYRGLDGTSPEELEEERRLGYVAITRARRRLILTHAAVRTLFGNTRYTLPSRFLKDIPLDVLEQSAGAWSQPPAASQAYAPGYGRSGANARHGWSGRPAADEFDQRVQSNPGQSDGWGATRARPSSSRPASPAPGQRSIDYDAFDDNGEQRSVRVARGSTVHHDRFGKGMVLEVVQGEQPRVLARFAGWGERRVLLTALRVE
jgi:DNA helicase-2/ATP-dependent DNA helicase PcrA